MCQITLVTLDITLLGHCGHRTYCSATGSHWSDMILLLFRGGRGYNKGLFFKMTTQHRTRIAIGLFSKTRKILQNLTMSVDCLIRNPIHTIYFHTLFPLTYTNWLLILHRSTIKYFYVSFINVLYIIDLRLT